ncbi:putative restriction endonuclease domain-containing protein [Candidatus Magnetomoraceae bacterium gMMP-15]
MQALQERVIKTKEYRYSPIIKKEEIFPPRSRDGMRVSEEEYWEKYYECAGTDEDSDFHYEWNNGILEEKPMPDYLSSKMYKWFFLLLEQYLKTNPIAKLIFMEIGFRMATPKIKSIRKPDIGVILNSNSIDIDDYDRSYAGTCDMCIEFLSDSIRKEAERDTIQKKREYRESGIKEYFILDRKAEKTAFYYLNKPGYYSQIKPKSGGIICSKLLPGFQFRIDDLYTHPSLIDMIDDKVYSPYILREHQAERQRADAEHQRAEVERKRAETADKKAKAERRKAEAANKKVEQLTAKLKELGIDPD